MSLVLILLIVLVLASLPVWPYSRSWGCFPSGLIGIIVLVLIALLLLGRI